MTTLRALLLAVGGLVFLFATATATADTDIPTGGRPSPLFGARPFSQPVPRFEEFGTQAIPTAPCVNCQPPAQPANCTSSPTGAQIDDFISQQGLRYLPTVQAYTGAPNPWAYRIGLCIEPLRTSVAEGRPPGEFFAHQREAEFRPEVYFQSVQAMARVNGGVRDRWQRHRYLLGEFGPGGLYHGRGTSLGTEIRFHPNMPVQRPTSVWTFDGTLPPKLLQARYGEGVLFRHYNGLPINFTANGGFGANTITTHLHNGHQPAESDGYTQAFFFPGQYYDYVWPMLVAGYDSINTDAVDIRMSRPNDDDTNRNLRGDYREIMSTLWFHDHMIDHTAENVYKGNAAMLNVYSGVDRGREGFQCNYTNPEFDNLCFPSGTALSWGNRDYDVNLLIADKAWDRNGQLWYNIFDRDGFLGDRVTVNWAWNPYMDVRARRYRFRLLNGAVARIFKIAVVTSTGQMVPFHMIGNDGNIMEHAVAFPNSESQALPEMSIGERFEIIIDFSRYAPGTRIYFVNVLAHDDGRGPDREIPIRDVLRGENRDDPAVGRFMEFRITAYGGVDRSMDPAQYVEGQRVMLPLPEVPANIRQIARRRELHFGRSGGTDDQPWTTRVDGGDGVRMDPRQNAITVDTPGWEIWTLSTGGGWSHPVHIHFEEGRILTRDGRPPPSWERFARKDMYLIGDGPDSSREMEVLIRFREFVGTYVEHCHNTTHEDHAMMLRFDARVPGQVVPLPTPNPTWEGVWYEPSVDLPSARVRTASASNRGPGR
ncbi:MAG: multicopper oxidase family protein [Hyphomonadaceae bacterium]